MIEEAAGTSLYETKRENTNKTLEKKDPKLKEVDTVRDPTLSFVPKCIDRYLIQLIPLQVLEEEVQPRIDKLREEQAAFAEFQRITRDIDHLTHIHISYTYLQTKKKLEGCENSIAGLKGQIEGSKQKIEDNIKEALNIDEQCKAMQEAIDQNTGGELAELEKELSEKSKAETKANSEKKSKITSIESDKRSLKNKERNINNDEKVLAAKNEEQARDGAQFQQLKEADENDAKAYADAQLKLEAISSGLATTEGGETASLQEQLNSKSDE